MRQCGRHELPRSDWFPEGKCPKTPAQPYVARRKLLFGRLRNPTAQRTLRIWRPLWSTSKNATRRFLSWESEFPWEGEFPPKPIPIAKLSNLSVYLHSILLTNYLAACGRENTDSKLIGGFAVSAPWNCAESCKVLEEPLNWLLFNRMLANNLCEAATRFVHCACLLLLGVRSNGQGVEICSDPLS
jgi:hypothetical protein